MRPPAAVRMVQVTPGMGARVCVAAMHRGGTRPWIATVEKHHTKTTETPHESFSLDAFGARKGRE